MVLKLKKNLNNNQNKGKAMLRLKSAQNTPKAAERQVSREYWEAYRQTQIGLDASLHALYATTDDVSRKKEYLDIMKHVRQAFVKTNAHLHKPPVRWWRSISAHQDREYTDTDQGTGLWMEV